jgi:hypothetical protein
MIPKSGYRLSEKIMLKQQAKAKSHFALEFRIKQNATNGGAQFFLVARFIHTVCYNFHSKKYGRSYFVRFGVIADQVSPRRRTRMCFAYVPEPGPVSQPSEPMQRGRTFLLFCQSRAPLRVSNDRPRLKAFCRVAFSVRLKLRAMLAARVFLPASRFNVRMSRLVHARLFIDLLR